MKLIRSRRISTLRPPAAEPSTQEFFFRERNSIIKTFTNNWYFITVYVLYKALKKTNIQDNYPRVNRKPNFSMSHAFPSFVRNTLFASSPYCVQRATQYIEGSTSVFAGGRRRFTDNVNPERERETDTDETVCVCVCTAGDLEFWADVCRI